MTTRRDPGGRRTVMQLVPGGGLYPVGRLDYHSQGLLVMTNDGDIAQRLSHPRYQISKKYVVKLDRIPDEASLEKLVRGVTLEDGRGRFESAKIVEIRNDKSAIVGVVCSEGRNRFVRRMFQRIKCNVDRLRRVEIGPLTLGKIPTGRFLEVPASQVRELRRSIGIERKH